MDSVGIPPRGASRIPLLQLRRLHVDSLDFPAAG
jgi:hypothetical protein